MPTVEERLAALEYALSNVMRQLQELASLGQQMNRRFDALEKALSHQFGLINSRFEAQDVRFTRIEQRIEQHTIDFRWKFDESNHYATETRGIVEMQQKDIREMKTELRDFKEENRVRFDLVDQRFDALENKMDLRFDQVLTLIKNQNN